jgi:hypothetical protein
MVDLTWISHLIAPNAFAQGISWNQSCRFSFGIPKVEAHDSANPM